MLRQLYNTPHGPARSHSRQKKKNSEDLVILRKAQIITNFVIAMINWQQNFVSSNLVCNLQITDRMDFSQFYYYHLYSLFQAPR